MRVAGQSDALQALQGGAGGQHHRQHYQDHLQESVKWSRDFELNYTFKERKRSQLCHKKLTIHPFRFI